MYLMPLAQNRETPVTGFLQRLKLPYLLPRSSASCLMPSPMTLAIRKETNSIAPPLTRVPPTNSTTRFDAP